MFSFELYILQSGWEGELSNLLKLANIKTAVVSFFKMLCIGLYFVFLASEPANEFNSLNIVKKDNTGPSCYLQ